MNIKKANQECINLIEKMFMVEGFLPFIKEDIITSSFQSELNKIGVKLTSGATRYVFYDLNNHDYVYKIDRFEYDGFCKTEAYNYSKAKEEHIEDFFAECDFVLSYEGREIYAMEFIECDEDSIESDLYCKIKSLECMDEYETEDFLYDLDSEGKVRELINFYFDHYDVKKFFEFCDFNEINDIHVGNIGYKNGKIKVLDYAGIY